LEAGSSTVEIQAQANRHMLWSGRARPGEANLGQTYIPNGGILVNAAFLLVTSAWFTCQTPTTPPATAPAGAPAPVIGTGPAITSSSLGCGGGGCGATGYDGCGCDSGCGSSWGGKLRGLFHRNSCNTCDTCNTCNTGCFGGGGGCGLFSRFGGGHNSCNTCNTCDTGCGSSWGGRLKGLFHRNSCCDTGCGCDGCGSGYGGFGGGVYGGSAAGMPTPAPGTTVPGGEALPNAPKKLPTTPVVPKIENKGQVRINNTPATTGAPFAPATPSVEVVPPAVPSLEAERRDPPF
jgi:hypothetical protein